MGGVEQLIEFLYAEMATSMRAFDGSPADREERLWKAANAMVASAEFSPLYDAAIADYLIPPVQPVIDHLKAARDARATLANRLFVPDENSIATATAAANMAYSDLERIARAATVAVAAAAKAPNDLATDAIFETAETLLKGNKLRLFSFIWRQKKRSATYDMLSQKVWKDGASDEAIEKSVTRTENDLRSDPKFRYSIQCRNRKVFIEELK